MKVPDLEAEIEEKARMMQFTCRNCGKTWSKHKIKKWTASLLCPDTKFGARSYFVGMDK